MTTPRDELKVYFKTNAIPTEGQFAELIDAALNQADDGVFKEKDQPLGIVAAAAPQKPVLKLYAEFKSSENSSPDWMICLNPKDPRDPTKNVAGLGIANGAGETKLMIGADGSLFVRGRMHADSLRIGNELIIENGNISGAKDVAAASATIGPVTISDAAGLRVREPGMTITSRYGLVVEGPVTVGNVAINDRTIDGVGWLGAGSAKIGGVSIDGGTITTGASTIGAASATIGGVSIDGGTITTGASTIGAASATIGGVTLTGGGIMNANSVSAGSVNAGSGTIGNVTLADGSITGASSISADSVTIVGIKLANGDITFSGDELTIRVGDAYLSLQKDGHLYLGVPPSEGHDGYVSDLCPPRKIVIGLRDTLLGGKLDKDDGK